jgi:hypothetical protein
MNTKICGTAICKVATMGMGALTWVMAMIGTAEAQQTNPGLDRHGPISAEHGFPEWYQDSTGLTLEMGTPLSSAELDGGWLLLLAGDTFFPERFPALFGGEHFYWSASVDGTITTPVGSTRLVLGMAHEAAFSTGEASPGDQVVFTRTRIDVRSAPYSGTYILETPYKTYELRNQVAGQRIRFTEDIGIAPAPEGFALSMKTPVGPYLVPAESPGGAELPPVVFEGRHYIADPNQTYTVTGSPLGRNFVRLLGPGGEVLFQSDRFALTGRLRTAPLPGGVTLERAARHDVGEDRRVDVFACGHPMLQPRKTGEPHSLRSLPDVDVFLGAPGTNGLGALTVPEGVTGVPFRRNAGGGDCYYVSYPVTGTFPTTVTARDQYGFISAVPVEAAVAVLRANYSITDRSLTVEVQSGESNVPMQFRLQGVDGLAPESATFADRIVVPELDAPPTAVTVAALGGGSVTVPVTVGLVFANSGGGFSGANNPPVASPDEFLVTVGVRGDLDLLGNDQDADGDNLVIVSVAQPFVGGVQQGVATVINGGKGIQYEPLPGSASVQQFSYVVSDGKGGSSSALVRIRVNLPPVANADSVFATDGLPVLIDVLANDSDADGGNLALVSVTGSAAVEVSLSEGHVLFRALAEAQSMESLTYIIADGQGGLATNRLIVTRNTSPVAVSETAFALVGAPSRLDVLANDSDVDGDVLVVASVVAPASGTASVSADGRAIEFNYGAVIPAGTVDVDYVISDGKGGTATARVSLLPNRAPVAVADVRTIPVGEWTTIAALANDTDADGDVLRVASVRATVGVTVQIINGGAAIEAEVVPAAAGTLPVITYTVTDGKGGIATSTITLNQAPTAVADSVVMNIGEVTTLTITANDTDPNGDAVTITAVQAPAGVSVLRLISGPQAGSTLQLTAVSAGQHAVGYTLSDGRGGTASGTVQVTVAGVVNHNPVAMKDSFVGQAGEAVALLPLLNDTDVDGDVLRIQSVNQPTNGTLTLDADGVTVWFTANQTASLVAQTVTYTVGDARGATAVAQIVLTARDQVTVSQAVCTGLRSWSVRGVASPGAVVDVMIGTRLLRRVKASATTGAWTASVVATVPAPVDSVLVKSSRGGSVTAPVTNR